MVDIEATSNFINRKIAQNLGVKIKELMEPLVCKFANDTHGSINNRVKNVRIEIVGSDRKFTS